MADSSIDRIRKNVADNPATGRLKDELTGYLEARAQHAVSSLGHKLGETATRLGEPGQGGGSLLKSLGKGGQKLAEGRSPGQAALSAGVSHAKDAVTDKVKGLFGKGRGKSGGGKSKSVLISEDIDVGVPVREAYDQWTQFQEFSTFAKGVVNVEKADDTSSNWTVKVAKSTRSWKANVTDQIPDERIAWTTEGAKGTVKGVVTFHRVTDDLTRVLLVLEYFPKGLFEKTGNIWRAQGRRARLDLKLYRKFIMMRGEATDGWRGEIRDGEVVEDHDTAVEREEHDEGREDGAEESYDESYDDEYGEDERADDGSGEAYDDAGDADSGEAYDEDDDGRDDADPDDEPYDEEDRDDEDRDHEADSYEEDDVDGDHQAPDDDVDDAHGYADDDVPTRSTARRPSRERGRARAQDDDRDGGAEAPAPRRRPAAARR
ncbi:SRPBCC family protein [Streptomyces sp. NPDC060194]|uniref:SRPBCC family protein n=1 Tax=Streptomyces sp. NPDC060194 TaxID=3347069 RepID=UPI003660F79F